MNPTECASHATSACTPGHWIPQRCSCALRVRSCPQPQRPAANDLLPDHVRVKSASILHKLLWDVACAVLHGVPIFDSPISSFWPTGDGFLRRSRESGLTGGLLTMALRGFAFVHHPRHDGTPWLSSPWTMGKTKSPPSRSLLSRLSTASPWWCSTRSCCVRSGRPASSRRVGHSGSSRSVHPDSRCAAPRPAHLLRP